jgi:hypothetical protein
MGGLLKFRIRGLKALRGFISGVAQMPDHPPTHQRGQGHLPSQTLAMLLIRQQIGWQGEATAP